MSTNDMPIEPSKGDHVAEALHAYWKGRIGYCYHEGSEYMRCEADAKWIKDALDAAGMEVTYGVDNGSPAAADA